MDSDEQEIRELVATWMEATKAGDLKKILSLMTDDVVFLVPGQPPMRKADFAAAAEAQTEADVPKFDGQSEIEELQILGDWAFMRSWLKVVVTPASASPPVTRLGYTLTIFKKEEGRWLLARDANLLATVANDPPPTETE